MNYKAIFSILIVFAITIVGCSKDEAPEVKQPQINNNNGGDSGGNQPSKKRVKKIAYEAVQVQATTKLWAYSRTGLGSTRTATTFTLPENSVALYYSFSTSTNRAKQVTDLTLFSQLKEIVAKNIYLKPINLYSRLAVPDTENLDVISVFFMDANQKEDFLKGNKYYSYLLYGRNNLNKAVVEVTSLEAMSPTLYPTANKEFCIGFQNNNIVDGIGVAVEVVAIIQKEVIIQE